MAQQQEQQQNLENGPRPVRSHSGGRKSKGDRLPLLTRIARSRHEEFTRHVKARGASNTDLAEQIILQWLDEHRSELGDYSQPGQQTFDMVDYRHIA